MCGYVCKPENDEFLKTGKYLEAVFTKRLHVSPKGLNAPTVIHQTFNHEK